MGTVASMEIERCHSSVSTRPVVGWVRASQDTAATANATQARLAARMIPGEMRLVWAGFLSGRERSRSRASGVPQPRQDLFSGVFSVPQAVQVTSSWCSAR